MPQCESKIFFPDDPMQPPQFNDCPRRAETTRLTQRQTHDGVITSVVKLCAKCAKIWDAKEAGK